jgi:predicted ATPase/class 3 adenylate cyclase
VLEFWILGPMVVRKDGAEIPVTGSVRRALLSRLLMSANRRISTEVLIDDVWDGSASVGTLYSTVRDVRKMLGEWGPSGISQAESGYILNLSDAELDVEIFERQLSEGRIALTEGRIPEAEAVLSSALARWRGRPLLDAGDAPWVTPHRSYLEQKHFETLDLWHEALLGLGRHAEAVATLEAAVADHPLQERLWSHLMVALYRSGRSSDALRAYQRLCEDLAELGNVPGPDLVKLESRILRQDPDLDLAAPPSTPSAPAERFERIAVNAPSGTVTMLMTDIEGSTRLWEEYPEEMAIALRRHDEILRRSIEEQEGHVVKTIGDAFHAAFANATGATMAAIEAQRVLGAENWPSPISLRVRMAIHTGHCEERDGDYFGPAVNRAARLEAIAHGGQVLLSEATAALVREGIPEDCSLIDLGEHRLKDLGRPEHVFQISAPGLEPSFPALRSLDNPELEHNLPIQLTSFVGREKEISEVHRLVDDSRLVTLVGPGGSGKTRLSLQVGADLVDGSGDGVWFADLSVLDADGQVARKVAIVLGVREEAGRPLLETLVESLQYQDLLLVLDNCEHVIDAAAKLAERIVRHCPKVHVLATSREPLAVSGERVYRVPPLGLPEPSDAGPLDPETLAGSEAVRLFVERAREHRPEFTLDAANARSVDSVCRHLDGIPLALELAAARVRSMSVEEVEGHLGQRFRLLSSRSRTAVARQQTLEGAIAWSYELLNDPEKLLFACLSVFPATFDLPATKSVCSTAAELDEFDVVDLLESLVDKSLVQTEQGPSDLRYRMLETIAQYAADHLAEAAAGATERANEAHALYYLGFVEEAAPFLTGSRQFEWMKRIEVDYDNVRTALSFLASNPGHGSEALRMVGALRSFWSTGLGGNRGKARDLAMAALAHPEAQSATKERSESLLNLGSLHEYMGEVDAAQSSYEAGLAIAEEIGDLALVADHLCRLAVVFYRRGEYGEAKDTAAQALEMADAIGDPNLQALAYGSMAGAESVDDHDAARLHYGEALRLYELAGNAWGVSRMYNNLGDLEISGGNVAAARSALEAALEWAVSPEFRAVEMANLALVHMLEGDPESAGSNYRDALRQLVRLGVFVHVPYILLGLAMCSGASGDEERSAGLHGAADAMVEAQGQPWEPTEAGLREKALAALRRRMGRSAFEAAYAQGLQMNGPDAVALALRDAQDTAG